MRKLTSLLGAVAMTGAALAAATAPAVASTPERAAASAHAASTPACVKGQVTKAKESVRIRKSRKLKSTSLGLFPKGKKAKWAACSVEYGQEYSLCGWDKDNRWTYIDYRGTRGWVPTACENFVS